MNIRKYILYPLALILFLADLGLFALFETSIFSPILCFYVIVLVNQNRIFPIIFSLFLLSLRYFILYSQIFTPIMIVITISLFGLWARIKIDKKYAINYIVLFLLIIAEELFVQPKIFGTSTEKIYTFGSICANLLLTAIFLKFFNKGKLGNRV